MHHITAEGEDAGVVYCEMQGRENSAESRLHLTLARNMYPGRCGYSSETGGIMKNLRESTTNEKVSLFIHKLQVYNYLFVGEELPQRVLQAWKFEGYNNWPS